MIRKTLFRRPNNPLEGQVAPPEPETMPCPACRRQISIPDLQQNLQVCPRCAHHLRMGARQRLLMLCDPDTLQERDAGLACANALDFPDYDEKLSAARKASGELEAVLCAQCTVDGRPCCAFAMEPRFMMGSMGSAVGEKITRLFEYAQRQSLPVVGFAVSGGARMQEGILSLMQMAKTSAAVRRHSDAGNLYISVLTDPTTGGVTASFAMLGDIIVAEPGALVGFAGPRVIEQTLRQKLPPGFQRAEFLLQKGFADAVVERARLRDYLSGLLALHQREVAL